MEITSITEMAMIAELHIPMIGMTGKDSSATRKSNQHLGTTNTAGYYSKCKIRRKDIQALIDVAEEARKYRKKVTRPWGEKDMRIVPTKMILEYQAKMHQFKMDFEREVLELQRNWPEIITKQEARLGPLYNPSDYPHEWEVTEHFRFISNLMPIPNEEHIVLDIEQEIVDSLKTKLSKDNEKRMNESMRELFKRMYEPVAKMAEICSQDKKVFASLTGNIKEQIEVLSNLNITNDHEFTGLLIEIKDRLVGYTPDQIRQDPRLKTLLGEEAAYLAAKLETKFEDNKFNTMMGR